MPSRSKLPSGFYVYQLEDPRTGFPFYVGKGQRDRAWHHERAVLSGNLTGNARKVKAITDLHDCGLRVKVKIVAEYALESDALEHEWRLVDQRPTLTNVLPGGIGPASSPELLLRLAKARARKLLATRAREKEASRRRLVDTKRAEFVALATSEKDRASITEWMDGLKKGAISLRHNSPHRYRGGSKAAVAEALATGRSAETAPPRRKKKRGGSKPVSQLISPA